MKIKKDALLRAIRQYRGEPVEFRELMRLFGIDKARRTPFKELVDHLVAEGELVKHKGNRLAIPTDAGLISGRLSTHHAGYGFVRPEGEGEDIFIPARHLSGNLHGDLVEVRVTAVKDGGRREGRVVRTLERALKRIVGRYEGSTGGGFVIPDDTRIARDLAIRSGHDGGAETGQVVVAEITRYPSPGGSAAGKVVEVLGWPDDPEVEVLAVIRKHELPDRFPPQVMAAARAAASAVSEHDLIGRTDLRGQVTVTIDGESARDFDDAVSVRREEGSRIRLWVSIADVAHYVREGTALDAEAYLRGTSVYFPDRCLPMLPEQLSNGICSLNPDTDRLTLTAEILFGRGGEVLETSFYPSVIRSRARLTYTEVRMILVDCDPEATAARGDLVPDLTLMEELAVRLMEVRRRRGSIDFDLPEPQIILDVLGGIQAIVRAERNLAHRIIEEFMLAANEAVARFIENQGIASLYRVHEPPDTVKLTDFGEFVRSFGYELRIGEERFSPTEFQRLLDQVAGKPEERLINEVLLRCMKQARYAAENIGHFGLAAGSYTHFTSPIRRYPDLVVHRIMKGLLNGTLSREMSDRLNAILPPVAEHCSRRERVAMEAEREVVDLKKVQFMLDKVGEEYDGFITGFASSGFFVELGELFVEGMVPLSSMSDDYYQFHEKHHLLMGRGSRTVFRLGDRVRVRVLHVSLERKQVEFQLAAVQPPRTALAVPEEYPRVPVKGKALNKVGGGPPKKPVEKRGNRRGGGGRRRKGRG